MNAFSCIVDSNTPYVFQFILEVFIQNLHYLFYFLITTINDMFRLNIENILIRFI